MNHDKNDDYGHFDSARNNISNFTEFPWYLSLWFIFVLSIFSFLIIPSIVAAVLINERLKYEDNMIDHLEMLEYQRDEVERVYAQREQILQMAHEESSNRVFEAEQKAHAMIKRAENESYNILCNAENERSKIISDFSDRENEVIKREQRAAERERDVELALEEVSRKLTEFYGQIGNYRKEAKVEYLKKNIENNTKDSERDHMNKNEEDSDDIFDTLRINLPDEYKE